MKKWISCLLGALTAVSVATTALAYDGTQLQSSVTRGLSYFETVAKPMYEQQQAQPNLYNLTILAATDKTADPAFSFMVPSYTSEELTSEAQSTTYANAILSALMLGNDPDRLFDGRDITRELADRQNAQGAFPFTKNGQEVVLVNDAIWAVIALSQTEVSFDREKAVAYFAGIVRPDGGFNYIGDDSESSVDMTAMALIALSSCKDVPGSKELIGKAVSFLTGKLDSDGIFIGDYNSKNSCTQASVITGLIAAGVDLQQQPWTNNGVSIVDALLSFQGENGGFWYDPTDTSFFTEPDEFSTKQALVGLLAARDKQVLWLSLRDQNTSTPDSSEESSMVQSSQSEQISSAAEHPSASSQSVQPANPNSGDKDITMLIFVVVLAALLIAGGIVLSVLSKKSKKK